MPKKKKTSKSKAKVRDLKPRKDAKGGYVRYLSSTRSTTPR